MRTNVLNESLQDTREVLLHTERTRTLVQDGVDSKTEMGMKGEDL